MTLIRTLLLSFFTLLFASIPAYAGSVDGIRIGMHGETTRMVLDIKDIPDFRAFVMQNPYRMAVDLPHYNWRVGKIGKPQGSGITAVRQGSLTPTVDRIVVDLDKPVGIRSAYIMPRSGSQPARLVIDFSGIPPEAFAAEKTRLFGTLRDSSLPAANRTSSVTSMPAAPVAAAAPVPRAPQTLGNLLQPPKNEYNDDHGMIVPGRKPDIGNMAASAPALPVPTGNRPLIVIDPGHGGIDPGALGANGVFEKNVSLGMARELKKQLEATGRYRVMLTRGDDTFIKLGERVDFARRNRANLFVSLHADSINRAGVEGASIYTLSDKASDAQTEKLAARENRADLIGGLDMKDQDEQVATILVDLMMRDNVNQSRFFANTVVSALKRNEIRMLENTHRSAGFAVLKAPDIPSVLIELGFMTSAREAARLSSESYRQKVSRALVGGIDAYFGQAGIASRM
jgi:N-acetylmuramoyl-L-alanine amidase